MCKYLIILALIITSTTFYGCGNNLGSNSIATQEQSQVNYDKIYNEALELGKTGEWEKCSSKLSEITSDENRFKYLSNYAKAQLSFALDTEEGYKNTIDYLETIPNDFEWDFKAPLQQFKEQAKLLYDTRKKEREAREEAERRAKEEAKRPPLTIENVILGKNSIGVPEATVIVRNVKNTAIDAFEITIIAFDAYDRPITKYGLSDGEFKGISQNSTIYPGKYSNPTWTLHGFDNGRKFTVKLRTAHFVDGTVWESENPDSTSYTVKY